MENIYQESIAAVQQGAKFQVNFTKKLLKIDNQVIINNGNYEGELGVQLANTEEFVSTVETMYDAYKHSMPSERSESQRCKYFMALPERCLADEDMMYGVSRDYAQITLELYVLCQILLGFQWNESVMGKWFWQSTKDSDLVILRKWINN